MTSEEIKAIINKRLDYFERGKESGFVSQNSYDDMRYFASKLFEDIENKEDEK